MVVSHPDLNDEVILPLLSSNPAPDTPSPVGLGLLRFYGCIMCHDLALPPYRERWGPDLDTVGSKTTTEWLDQFLRDPQAARKDARMPRVPMSDSTRTLIVDMLATLVTDLPELVSGSRRDGEALYSRGDCRSCHKRGGTGGDKGPALDGLGQRIRRKWLFAYLMDPTEMISNSRMPLFPWEEEEAVALASYLVGEDPPENADERVGRERVYRGASKAAQLGCFQCHRIRRFARSLDLPNRESAQVFIRHHQNAEAELRFSVNEAQGVSMAEALFNKQHAALSDGDFLKSFWKTPIPLQGASPAAHDSLSSGLKPQNCASCHEKQHREWQGSLHAAAMGPGVIGQLRDQAYASPAFVGSCQDCHAPNAEQYASLPDDQGHSVNYEFDAGFREGGITCVACHVRTHARFGPPASDRPPVNVWQGSGHGGANESTVYQSSEFCSSCHQFVEGNKRMNGSFLQNTFEEWQASPQSRQGQTCQSCHMSGRSHRWLGIHDSTTVIGAMKVQVSLADIAKDSTAVVIRIRNVGAGHHLPTYVTPKIFVNAVLVDSAGNAREESLQLRAIGREIVLNSQESREIYDTRIPAGGVWSWRYAVPSDVTASGIEVTLEVFPDHFYARFFQDYERSDLSAEASEEIGRAGVQAAGSNYTAFRKTFSLHASSDR